MNIVTMDIPFFRDTKKEYRDTLHALGYKEVTICGSLRGLRRDTGTWEIDKETRTYKEVNRRNSGFFCVTRVNNFKDFVLALVTEATARETIKVGNAEYYKDEFEEATKNLKGVIT